MKKSKMAAKIKAKKKAVPAKKTLTASLKKTATKILAKMTAKAKKPQVKVPSKAPVKPAVKTPAKPVVKAKPSVQAKPVKKVAEVKPVKPVAPVKPVKGKPVVETKGSKPVAPANDKISKAPAKGGKASGTAVVAAVLTKPGKAAKAPKVAVHNDKMCREANCENMATTKGYCRLDYIKNWKKIKRKEMILKEGKLNQYIEELVSKYPDKYIDVIRQDLSTELNFNKVIHDLELDESIDDLDYDSDSIDALIGGIKKDIDDFSGGSGGEEEF